MINIGCSTNDSYSQHLGIMLFSLLKNCSCPEEIIINLMDGGISEENRKKLNLVVKKFNAKIEYIKPKKEELTGLKVCRHITLESYYRFFLFENKKIKKIIYLDGDLIVREDIKKLWEIDLKEKIIGAIPDPGGSNKRKKILGMPKKLPYFNAGVMLINCEKFRKEKITQKTLNYIKNNPEKIEFADQDGLNVTLLNKWKILDPKWNLITKLIFHKYIPLLKIPNYRRKNIFQIIENPKIIHYASFLKPWFFLDPIPNKRIYKNYLKKTPWKNYKYPDKTIKGIVNRLSTYLKIIDNKSR